MGRLNWGRVNAENRIKKGGAEPIGFPATGSKADQERFTKQGQPKQKNSKKTSRRDNPDVANRMATLQSFLDCTRKSKWGHSDPEYRRKTLQTISRTRENLLSRDPTLINDDVIINVKKILDAEKRRSEFANEGKAIQPQVIIRKPSAPRTSQIIIRRNDDEKVGKLKEVLEGFIKHTKKQKWQTAGPDHKNKILQGVSGTLRCLLSRDAAMENDEVVIASRKLLKEEGFPKS